MIFALQMIFLLGLPLVLFLLLFHPQFGGRAKRRHRMAYARSQQWNGSRFENSEETRIDVNVKTMPGLLKAQFTGRKARRPQEPIPVIPFDKEAWDARAERSGFIWYGHSVALFRIGGKTLLVDPMFGPDAAPIGPMDIRRFSDRTLELIDDLPAIDAVLLTHDHYDHIDLKSISALIPKVDRWLVGLGIGRHLERWKVPSAQISEFDWWQELTWDRLKICFTPSRHFTGRGPMDRQGSLWGGWAIAADELNIYWSGDGGYGGHFREIGTRLGPFDHAFMECGQYNELWRQIHLHPEESVQAALDVGAKVATPVHWAGFDLALHHWKEPIERFRKEVEKQGLIRSTPRIGELKDLAVADVQDWWTELK